MTLFLYAVLAIAVCIGVGWIIKRDEDHKFKRMDEEQRSLWRNQ